MTECRIAAGCRRDARTGRPVRSVLTLGLTSLCIALVGSSERLEDALELVALHHMTTGP